MVDSRNLTSPRWECIHFATAGEASRLAADLAGESLFVVSRKATAVRSDAALFSLLSEALLFPAYFGNNWDALEECLGDLSWIGTSGYVLVLENAGALWREAPLTAGKLVSVWLSVAEEWSGEKVPFHLVFGIP